MGESAFVPDQARTRSRPPLALIAVVLFAGGLAGCSSVATTAGHAAVMSASTRPPALRAPSPTPPAPSPTPPAPSPTSPLGSQSGRFDACAAIANAELVTIVGQVGYQAKPMPSGGWVAGQCSWNGLQSGFFLSIGTAFSLAAFGDPAAPNARAKLAQFKIQASATGTVKDVAGIGDNAVLGQLGIAAYKGSTYAQITNLGLTDEQLVRIMKAIVRNL